MTKPWKQKWNKERKTLIQVIINKECQKCKKKKKKNGNTVQICQYIILAKIITFSLNINFTAMMSIF